MVKNLGYTLDQIIAAYTQYSGTGMYMCIYFISLLYIYMAERRKTIKTLLCYYPLTVLVVVFNPLFTLGIKSFIEMEVYWRMFWTLSISVIIAYAATSISLSNFEKKKKSIVIFVLTIILIFGGKFIFTSENYKTSYNWYKLPEQTIEVCEIIEKDCAGDIRVVVPADLEVSVRQYDANIQMVYGRQQTANVVDSDYGGRVALGALMQEHVLNVPSITKWMIYFKCNYLVIQKTAPLTDGLGNYGYHCIAFTDSYNIYRFNLEEANTTV